MSRNSLTKPSNFSKIQDEHRSRSFDPRGARAEDGQGVGCWERWRVGTSCCGGKKRVACAFSNPAEQKKSLPALLSPLMQPSAKAPQQSSPSPGTESSNPARSSGESTNHRFHDSPSLQPTCVRGGLPCSRVARRAPTVEQIGLWRNRSGSLPSSSSGTTSQERPTRLKMFT